jgi:hypothetical protein
MLTEPESSLADEPSYLLGCVATKWERRRTTRSGPPGAVIGFPQGLIEPISMQSAGLFACSEGEPRDVIFGRLSAVRYF